MKAAITGHVNRLVQPKSIDHVHLIEDHLDSLKSPTASKKTAKQNRSTTKKAIENTPNEPWGRKKALAEDRQKAAKTRKMDLLKAELRAKIELFKNKRMSASGKTPQKKPRESKKVRREKNKNKPGLGPERSVMKNKHKIMKLATSKIANRASKHQLLLEDQDSDE